MIINDRKTGEEFKKFIKTSTISWETILLSKLLYFLITFQFLFRFFKYTKQSNYTIIFTIAFGTIMLSYILQFSSFIMRIKKKSDKWIGLIDSIGMFLIVFSMELVMFGRVLTGSCENISQSYIWQWQCNSQYESKTLPADLTLLLMFAPLYCSIMFHSRFRLILIIWISVVVSLTIVIAIGSLTSSIYIFIVYFLTSMLMLIQIRRQNLSNFYSYLQLQLVLSENERLADESLASELRHMIGNVAHDLKTVLFLFYFK
jgi:hypothetical protein